MGFVNDVIHPMHYRWSGGQKTNQGKGVICQGERAINMH